MTQKVELLVEKKEPKFKRGQQMKNLEKIIGIDISKESVYSAKHNAKLNKFPNVTFELGEVSKMIPKILSS